MALIDTDARRAQSRRAFLGALAAAAGSLVTSGVAWGQDRSRVVLVRHHGLDSILNTFHYQKILDMLTEAIELLTGETSPGTARRKFFGINDNLGVQIAAHPVGVVPEVVDAVCTTAARAGVSPDRMFIYSADERELFKAGFGIKREGPGVRCYGARSEGYRDSVSKLVLPHVTAIANVPCLSPHPVVGLSGALHNFVNSVTLERQHEAYISGGERLPAVLSKNALQTRIRLHVMDCVRPAYDIPETGKPKRWAYDGLIVSTDPVAIDAVGTAILEAKRREIAGADWPLDPSPIHVEAAATRFDLGTSDLNQIEILRIGPMDDALI